MPEDMMDDIDREYSLRIWKEAGKKPHPVWYAIQHYNGEWLYGWNYPDEQYLCRAVENGPLWFSKAGLEPTPFAVRLMRIRHNGVRVWRAMFKFCAKTPDEILLDEMEFRHGGKWYHAEPAEKDVQPGGGVAVACKGCAFLGKGKCPFVDALQCNAECRLDGESVVWKKGRAPAVSFPVKKAKKLPAKKRAAAKLRKGRAKE